MIKTIDSAILAGCTRFSHWLQRLTGLTNYFIANLGLGYVVASYIIQIVNHFWPMFSVQNSWMAAIVSSVLVIICIRDSFTCTKAQDQLYSGNATKPAELLKIIGSAHWRFICLMFLIIAMWTFWVSPPRTHYWIFESIGRSFWFGVTIFEYFVAVDPLPPGKNKVRQWIEAFRGMRQGLPAPAKS